MITLGSSPLLAASNSPKSRSWVRSTRPAAREIPDSDAVYFNTSSWLPSFVNEDTRRQRTGGLDVEFTFLEISRQKNEDYTAMLKRWNDAAGVLSQQIVDPIKPKEKKKG